MNTDLILERLAEDSEVVVTLDGDVVPYNQFSTGEYYLWSEPSELLGDLHYFIKHPKRYSAIHVYWDGTFYQLNHGYLKI